MSREPSRWQRWLVPSCGLATGALLVAVLAYAAWDSGRFFEPSHIDSRYGVDARRSAPITADPVDVPLEREGLSPDEASHENDRSEGALLGSRGPSPANESATTGPTNPSGGQTPWLGSADASLLEWAPDRRSFESGRSLYANLRCNGCHRLNGEGGPIGPDLADTRRKRLRGEMSRAELLREIVDPSAHIAPDYQTLIVIDVNGRLYSGLLIEETGTELRIAGNPLENQGESVIPLADIDERMTSPVSLMPAGMTDQLDVPQLLDLLAYVEANGDPESFADPIP